VGFTVTFSEAVQNVDAADFSVTASGASSGTVSGVAGSGSVYTLTVSVGAGNGTLRLDLPAGGGINDLAGNPLAGTPYTDGESYTVKKVLTVRSTGAQDGWVLAKTSANTAGGSMNATATTLRLGDDAAKKQYRDTLSFTTQTLPDNAVITKVTLKLKKSAVTGGGDPITMFGGFMVDVKKGTFGTASLQPTDFAAAANKTVGPFKPTLTGGWYTINLSAAKLFINKMTTSGGLTQIRLRFKTPTNNDVVVNYLSLFSGNAGTASRPQLIVEYYVP
jgi:hypothetical protein